MAKQSFRTLVGETTEAAERIRERLHLGYLATQGAAHDTDGTTHEGLVALGCTLYDLQDDIDLVIKTLQTVREKTDG